jgi:hypothetical protein
VATVPEGKPDTPTPPAPAARPEPPKPADAPVPVAKHDETIPGGAYVVDGVVRDANGNARDDCKIVNGTIVKKADSSK